jgi:eukaryotic-like serine/threonine-protein kinase
MTHPPEHAQLPARFSLVAELGTTRLTHVARVAVMPDGTTALWHRLRPEAATVAPLVSLFSALYPPGPRHPLWLQVSERETAAGRPWALTEDCDGLVLRRLLPMPALHAVRCIRQMCSALSETDGPFPPISSRHLVQLPDGRLKWIESWLQTSQRLTADLAYYQAPELRRGVAPAASATVYGLGMLLFELLTAQRPHDAAADRRLPQLRSQQPHYLLPDLERILAVATATAAAERFADPAALQAALLQVEVAAERPTRRLAIAPAHGSSGRDDVIGHARPPVAVAQRSAPARKSPVADWRRQNRRVHLQGSLLLISLLVCVVVCSFAIAGRLVVQLGQGGVWPGEQRIAVQSGRRSDDSAVPAAVYSVNIAEGLNLRREPGAVDRASIVAVLPNGAIVTALEGPRQIDSVSWLRVRAEHAGRSVEGWMVMRFLRAQP